MAHLQGSPLDRRTLLRGAGGGLVAATWLVACGDDQPSDSSSAGGNGGGNDEGDGDGSSGGTGEGDGGGTGEGDGDGNGGGGSGTSLSTSEVTVGGGVIVDEQYVVTQPSKGDFRAFTAICTHMGCVVASVKDNTIHCNCHGSEFDAATGEVTNGPATAPLADEPLTVQGDQITLG